MATEAGRATQQQQADSSTTPLYALVNDIIVIEERLAKLKGDLQDLGFDHQRGEGIFAPRVNRPRTDRERQLMHDIIAERNAAPGSAYVPQNTEAKLRTTTPEEDKDIQQSLRLVVTEMERVMSLAEDRHPQAVHEIRKLAQQTLHEYKESGIEELRGKYQIVHDVLGQIIKDEQNTGRNSHAKWMRDVTEREINHLTFSS